jgi:hypothetical protein
LACQPPSGLGDASTGGQVAAGAILAQQSVRFAQSYILGRLRNVTFFSLAECNAAIVAAVERMNDREMRRLGTSRRQLFEAIELPVIRRLPHDDFEYAEWHLARVGIDFHVEVQGCQPRKEGK